MIELPRHGKTQMIAALMAEMSRRMWIGPTLFSWLTEPRGAYSDVLAYRHGEPFARDAETPPEETSCALVPRMFTHVIPDDEIPPYQRLILDEVDNLIEGSPNRRAVDLRAVARDLAEQTARRLAQRVFFGFAPVMARPVEGPQPAGSIFEADVHVRGSEALGPEREGPLRPERKREKFYEEELIEAAGESLMEGRRLGHRPAVVAFHAEDLRKIREYINENSVVSNPVLGDPERLHGMRVVEDDQDLLEEGEVFVCTLEEAYDRGLLDEAENIRTDECGAIRGHNPVGARTIFNEVFEMDGIFERRADGIIGQAVEQSFTDPDGTIWVSLDMANPPPDTWPENPEGL